MPRMILLKVSKGGLILSKLQKLTKGIKIFLNFFLGPALFVWIAFSIYEQMRTQPNLHASLQHMLGIFGTKDAWKMWVCFLLMPVNWAIEARKWYILVHREQPFTFKRAFQSVLSGISLSLTTPNRIGEFGGRILHLDPATRLKGVALTLYSSIAQLLITLLIGLPVLYFLSSDILEGYHVEQETEKWFWICYILTVLATLALGFFYFRFDRLIACTSRIPFLQKYFPVGDTSLTLPFQLRFSVLGYSMLRYLVFTAQYVLLWQALGADIGIIEGVMGIALVFFLMSIVPTIALVELGMRGKLAIGVMALFSINHVAILTGTVVIWLLNLILPALVGSAQMFTVKLFKA